MKTTEIRRAYREVYYRINYVAQKTLNWQTTDPRTLAPDLVFLVFGPAGAKDYDLLACPGNYLEDCQEIITLVCDDNQTKIIGNLPTITKNHGIENYQPTPGETLAEKQEAARNYVSEYSSQRSLGVLRDLLTFAEVPCQHDTLNIAEQDYPIIAFRPDGQQITAANKLSLKNIKNKIQPWLQENLIVIKSPGGDRADCTPAQFKNFDVKHSRWDELRADIDTLLRPTKEIKLTVPKVTNLRENLVIKNPTENLTLYCETEAQALAIDNFYHQEQNKFHQTEKPYSGRGD